MCSVKIDALNMHDFHLQTAFFAFSVCMFVCVQVIITDAQSFRCNYHAVSLFVAFCACCVANASLVIIRAAFVCHVGRQKSTG